MSVKVRPYRNGGWEVDVRVALPGGRGRRARKKTPCSSRSAAARWGDELQRRLHQQLVDEQVEALQQPREDQEPDPAEKAKEEVPTFEEFAPRFIEGHSIANRQKPSGVAGTRSILRVHILPLLGGMKLDEVTNQDVQRLKLALRGKAAKTTNNVLTVLGTMLKVAVAWEVLAEMPCTVALLKAPKASMKFHDFDEFETLVAAAGEIDPRAELIVLLGGEAGLRCGEMMALERSDLDLVQRQICVERSDWKGQVTATKGERFRRLPLTSRLVAALKRMRHLRGARVLCESDGRPLTQKVVQGLVKSAAKRAGLSKGGLHILRHTFCSHLAMRGVPVTVIQRLAGHRELSTTIGYMHLNPRALAEAINLLDHRRVAEHFGDILETAGKSS